MNARAAEWDLQQPAVTVPEPKRTGEISAALAKAQAEMTNPGFDSVNPHFKNKFATLAAVRNAVVPSLAKHGIAMSQNLASVEGGVSCTTLLMHASGQTLVFGPLVLPVSKNDAQGFGSAATYARRYSLMAVAGVVGDDDDDANAATGKPAAADQHNPRGDLGKNIDPEQAKATAAAMNAIMDSDVEEAIKALRVLDKHEVLNRDPDLYVAAADKLGPKGKSAWRAYVTQGNAAQKADRAVESMRR